MSAKEKIAKELSDLCIQGVEMLTHLSDERESQNYIKITFQMDYQSWYTKVIRTMQFLAPDRVAEFRSYYEIDPKRKVCGFGTYAIQDYLKGVAPNAYTFPGFDCLKTTIRNLLNQVSILKSVNSRIESVLADAESLLLAELQDTEVSTALELLPISIRAAGALAGVILEGHLQKIVHKRGISLTKRHPTIADINDVLKQAEVYETATWRKISYLADIRNACSHKKETEPTEQQVRELIEGTNWAIKNIF